MSHADTLYINMCKEILENGTSTEGEKVRPHWEDGSLAYTMKKFGVINRYDLRKEFPIITLRPIALKSAFDEILWIYQAKSNNINDLHSHIWDSWADENGSIGKAYGYQIAQKYVHHVAKNVSAGMEDLSMYPSAEVIPIEGDKAQVLFDQMDAVLYDLRNNPYSRRIMTNMYDHEDLHEMGLYPCAYSLTFNVTKDPNEEKLVLNAVLNQRSQDVLAAGGWNPTQYACLLMCVAQSVDMIPGELIHVISDCHIYDRHLPIIRELIERPTYPAPKVWINPEVKDFYQFTRDDIKLIDYEKGPQIKDIPVAV